MVFPQKSGNGRFLYSGNSLTLLRDRSNPIFFDFDEVFNSQRELIKKMDLSQSNTIISLISNSSYSAERILSGIIELTQRFFRKPTSIAITAKIARLRDGVMVDCISGKSDCCDSFEIKDEVESQEIFTDIINMSTVRESKIFYFGISSYSEYQWVFINALSSQVTEIMDCLSKNASTNQQRSFDFIISKIKGSYISLDFELSDDSYEENEKLLKFIKPLQATLKVLSKQKSSQTTNQLSWKKFIMKRKGNQKYESIEKSRLVLISKNMANDSSSTKEELDEVLKELETQLLETKNYKDKAPAGIQELKEKVFNLKEVETKLMKKQKCLKTQLLELQVQNNRKNSISSPSFNTEIENYVLVLEYLRKIEDDLNNEICPPLNDCTNNAVDEEQTRIKPGSVTYYKTYSAKTRMNGKTITNPKV